MSVDASFDLTGTKKINHIEYRLGHLFDSNNDKRLSDSERQNLLKSLDEKGIPKEFHWTDDLHPDNILSNIYFKWD